MSRTPLRLRDLNIGGAHPTRIMGVINLSPESFYRGSIAAGPDDFVSAVHIIEQKGADVIDVGGASTAPRNIYSRTEITVQEEKMRIERFLKHTADATRLPVSIDTMSAIVAETALDLGASIVNDVSGLRADSAMADLIAERQVPIVLMANCGGSCEGVQSSLLALRESLRIASSAGIAEDQIIIDPGIGFGKPVDADLALIRDLRSFSLLGHPLLVGVSRKAFIGNICDKPDPEMRLPGTIAATAIAVANGADIVRAHDVEEAVAASQIGRALRPQRHQIIDDMEIYEGYNEREIEMILGQIGVGGRIRTGLAKKSVLLNLRIRKVRAPAAIIIKQEMLALGGDAAYHHGVIDSEVDMTEVLIMGTLLHLKKLSKKLGGMKYFGLSGIGASISRIVENREM